MIYLDNAASTPLDPEVFETMRPWLSERFGNPSSPHRAGQAARAAVERARGEVAGILGARPEEAVFTASGTAATGLALLGLARARARAGAPRRVLLSAVEHDSVRAAAAALAMDGFEIRTVPVGSTGLLRIEALAAAAGAGAAAAAIQHGSPETGTVQPIESLRAVLDAAGIPLLCDCVATAGRLPLPAAAARAISAHKFHGPKGAGALLLSRDVPFDPPLGPASQEGGRRGGTEDVAGVVGLAAALRKAAALAPAARERARALRARLLSTLAGARIPFQVHGDAAALPDVIALRLEGIDGDALLVRLDLEGIAVGRGPACASGAPEPLRALEAMGIPEGARRETIRVSLSRLTDAPEIDALVSAIGRVARGS